MNEIETLKQDLKDALTKLDKASHDAETYKKKSEMLEFQLRQYFLAIDSQSIIDVNTIEGLTNKEKTILVCIASGLVIDRSDIIKQVWNSETSKVSNPLQDAEITYFQSRTLDVHITKLRKTLKKYGYSIKTIHGRGFQLIQD